MLVLNACNCNLFMLESQTFYVTSTSCEVEEKVFMAFYLFIYFYK